MLKHTQGVEDTEFLEETTELVRDTMAVWCNSIVSHEKIKLDDSEPNSCLYRLTHAGATICTMREKIPENLELLQQLAALCYLYSPSRHDKLYFILEKNHLAREGKTDYLASYFFFLKNFLIVEEIDFSFRLACLSGVLQFYTIYKQYLTNAFIEKLFRFFNSAEAKAFFREYSDFKAQKSDLNIYIPTYQFLSRNSKTFWEETVSSSAIEAWKSRLKNEIAELIKMENVFIKKHGLTYFSLFEKEFSEFIRLLLLNENEVGAIELEKEIFLPTRTIKEQIAIFTQEDNPLYAFFSDLLNSLREKNQLETQQVSAKCEAEENRRIKLEEEEKAARQLNEEEQKHQQKEQREKRVKEEEIRKIKEKAQQEILYLKSDIAEVFSSLKRAISYVTQRIQVFETKNTDADSLSRKFNSELGKMCSKLESIYDRLHLERKIFLRNQSGKYISDFLLEVKNKIKETHFPEKEVNAVMEKIIKMETYIENEIKDYGSEIIKKLEALQTSEEKLRAEVIANVKFLESNSKLSSEKIEKFNKCRTNIERLLSQFNHFAIAFSEYAQLIPMDQEFKKLEGIQENLSLVKTFSVLAKELEANTKAKQLATKAPPLTQTGQLPADFLSDYRRHIDWEKDFKARFYETLSIIHRLPYIKDDQGGKAFIAIFLRKLAAYKQEIAHAYSDLLKKWEKELTRKNRRAWYCRMQEEKAELDYLDALIATVYRVRDKSEFNLSDIAQINFVDIVDEVFSKNRYSLEDILIIYLKGKKEFTEMGLEPQVQFKECVSSFETFLLTLQACEDTFIASKLLYTDTFFSKNTTNEPLEAEYLQRKKLLTEKRVELNERNKGFLEIFSNYQLHQSESTIFSIQPVSIVSVSPIVVVTVPSVQVPTIVKVPVGLNSYGAFFSSSTPSMGNQVGPENSLEPKDGIPHKNPLGKS